MTTKRKKPTKTELLILGILDDDYMEIAHRTRAFRVFAPRKSRHGAHTGELLFVGKQAALRKGVTLTNSVTLSYTKSEYIERGARVYARLHPDFVAWK